MYYIIMNTYQCFTNSQNNVLQLNFFLYNLVEERTLICKSE